jgi:hypothetical protein
VEAERDGREVRYRLADPDVMVACGVMRGVLERRLTRLGEMAADALAADAVATGDVTDSRQPAPIASR